MIRHPYRPPNSGQGSMTKDWGFLKPSCLGLIQKPRLALTDAYKKQGERIVLAKYYTQPPRQRTSPYNTRIPVKKQLSWEDERGENVPEKDDSRECGFLLALQRCSKQLKSSGEGGIAKSFPNLYYYPVRLNLSRRKIDRLRMMDNYPTH